jgi:hypothetical protein
MPREPSRVNTQASVLRWVVGREVEVFSASRRGPLPQLNLHRLHSVFSRWDVPGRVGLVLAMSFERTGLPCVLIHFPLHPPTFLVAHCW